MSQYRCESCDIPLTPEQLRVEVGVCPKCRAEHTVSHIRQPLPPKGGNSFYRDNNDYSKFAVSLCGAPITDKDIDYRLAGTKKFKSSGWPVCMDCKAKRERVGQ